MPIPLEEDLAYEDQLRAHTLRQGEATAGRWHYCKHCHRPIAPRERAWHRVVLEIDGKYRAVIAEYSCCKPI